MQGGHHFRSLGGIGLASQPIDVDFPRFNETFRAYFDGEKVTRTCFGGTLHRAGTDVEIDCVAMFE